MVEELLLHDGLVMEKRQMIVSRCVQQTVATHLLASMGVLSSSPQVSLTPSVYLACQPSVAEELFLFLLFRCSLRVARGAFEGEKTW